MKIIQNQIKKQIDTSLTNWILENQPYFLLETQMSVKTEKKKKSISTKNIIDKDAETINIISKKIVQSTLNGNQILKNNPNFLYSISIVLFGSDEELILYCKNSNIDKRLLNCIKIREFCFETQELYRACCFDYNSLYGLYNTSDEIDFNIDEQQTVDENENYNYVKKSELIHSQLMYC